MFPMLQCLLLLLLQMPYALGHGGGDDEGSFTYVPLNLGDPSSKEFTDTTLRFAVIGDVQGQWNTAQLSTDVLDHNIDAVLYPGDLVNYGADGCPTCEHNDSWDEFIDNTAGVFYPSGQSIEMWMVPGNHDMGNSTYNPVDNTTWQNKFANYPSKYGGGPWLPDSPTIGDVTGVDKMDYYVDYGNTRIISVTTDSDGQSGFHVAALDWFTNVLNLESTQSKDHVFVMTHRAVTFTRYEGAAGTKGSFWQAMVDSGAPVRGLFVGHWHMYAPGKPDPYSDIWEVTIGTGSLASGESWGHGYAWMNKNGFLVVNVDGSEVTGEFWGDGSADNGPGPYDDLHDSFTMFSATPETGLVAHYAFSDTNNNIDSAPSGGIYSSLGKGNDGVYMGGLTASDGKITLDGQNDYAVGYGVGGYNMALLRDLTLSVKVSVDTLDSGDAANALISHLGDLGYSTGYSENVNQPYNLRIRNDKKIAVMWERDHGLEVSFVSDVAASTLDDGQEHEIQVIRDAAAGELRIFVDGTQLGSGFSFDPLRDLPTGGHTAFLHVGANNEYGLISGYFDGAISDVKIYNSVNPDGYTFGSLGGVSSSPTLTLNQTSYTTTEDVVVSWGSTPGAEQEWVTFFHAGGQGSEYLQWAYTGGGSSGSHNLGVLAAEGEYRAVIYEEGWASIPLADKYFTVTNGGGDTGSTGNGDTGDTDDTNTDTGTDDTETEEGGDTTPPSTSSDGCGCASAPLSATVFFFLLPLIATRRRGANISYAFVA
jgi:hypothetical protein